MLYIGNPPKGEMSQSALLKDQNTKTSLYKLSKNHWIIALLENFGSVRRKLQSTVSLDHPVFLDVLVEKARIFTFSHI